MSNYANTAHQSVTIPVNPRLPLISNHHDLPFRRLNIDPVDKIIPPNPRVIAPNILCRWQNEKTL